MMPPNRRVEDHAVAVLENMPESPNEVAAWFAAMKANQFDSVCSSAIAYSLNSILEEGGFISVRDVTVMTNAMRDRYRTMLADEKSNQSIVPRGEANKAATINELQARIIRRLPIAKDRYLGDTAIGRLFGTSAMAVYKIRNGKTWKHLSRRAA